MMDVLQKVNRYPVLFLMIILLIAGCDDSFMPLKERNTHPFSIFGYLEYPADVNWIRVTEIRNSLYRDQKDTLDTVVTLQNLESGQTEVMQDSLIRFEEGIYAYNFRTFMEIDPEQSYQLKAERSDGQFSSVTVTLPGTFPTPSVQISVDHTMYFFIENVENLADVRVTLNDAEGRPWEFPHRHDAVKVDDNSWRVIINLRPQLNAFFGHGNIPETYRAELYIASAGPGWIDFSDVDPLVAELPETANVENGAGYVVGVVSETISLRYGE